MLQQMKNYFSLKVMQYELLLGLSVMEPWEKCVIYIGQLLTVAFFIYRIYIAIFA